jgi:hypothetical protein
VEGHVELVPRAEVGTHVLGPHVGLGQQDLAREALVEAPAQVLEHLVGLGQVLARGPLALDEIRDRVHAEAVHPHLEPEAHDLPGLLAHRGVVEVQVRLVAEEAVPVVRLRDRVPRPVRALGVDEDDAHAAVLVVRVAPHVPVAARVVPRAAGRLEPGVLVRRVVEHQLGDDAQPAGVRGVEEGPKVLEGRRSRGGSGDSRRCRSRRPGRARGTWAAATGSPRPGPGGGRASSAGHGSRLYRRRCCRSRP